MRIPGLTETNEDKWPATTVEMAARIRQFAWESTHLGQIASWSACLRRTVEMMLSCGFPCTLQWGEQGILMYNDPYIQLIGARHPSALGRPIFETFPEIIETYKPLFERVRSGETLVFEDLPYRYIREDKAVDTWFTLSYSPIRNDAGAVAAVLAIGFETTSRVALRQSEERYRTLFENVDEGCMVIEQLPLAADGRRDYRYILMNRASTMMFGKPDLTGQTIRANFPDEDEEWYEFYDQVLSTGNSLRFERASLPQGKVLEMFLACFGDPTDKRLLVLMRDVTERRRAQEALRQSEKLAAVGRLASSIAHEINNPLEAVTNLVYLARRENISPVAASLLDQADKELRRVSLITTETLRFHRQQSLPVRTDIAELLDSILILHESRLMQARITTERRYKAHPEILCLPNDIRQVLANLISNAIEAMNANTGTRILTLRLHAAVNSRTGERGITVLISDNGSGMNAAARARAFEPFFTTKEATNSGLGLWIVREIVEKHHGHLRFRTSQAGPRRGTLFSLFLAATPSASIGAR
ncbi:ATP-binding protein [Telmatobacter sp. DSM 110680]|uniref:histidine kinase n=1 Tax=Telmatobacter sp. DSM 110680 TaxID=3036704 RepID=A0AAU7DKU4_9BACT